MKNIKLLLLSMLMMTAQLSYGQVTLAQQDVADEIVLISPFFKNSGEANGNDFYWSGVNWRNGSESINSAKISSYEVIDRIVDQLADKDHFPVLDKIIITGHSSGALFTHLYAAANASEAAYQEISFEYVVANSQYFYYPNEQRINESDNQLYTPSSCSGSEIWPFGFTATPPYLSVTDEITYNSQFTDRSITYLLGNGNQPDPTLNTSSCQYTILGSSRYKRGENMFRYMELANSGAHNHSKTIVNGIGHDGSGMYQSSEFKMLLTELLQR